MAAIFHGRHTAETDEPFVVFLIGMRFNRPLALRRWLPVVRAMPAMLRELARDPESGLLHYQTMLYWPGLAAVQYWRSFEHLERFARDPARQHQPAWRAFNRDIGADGSVGIWHETYLVEPGRFECIHANMPRFGAGAALRHRPVASARDAARQRLIAAE